MQDSTKTMGTNDVPEFTGEAAVHYDRLIDLREHLLEELKVLSGYSLTSNKQAGEELADIGSENFLREMELGLVTEEGRRIRQIDEAIGRLKNGTYGLCQECNKKINEGRLEALPYARMCVTCKTAREAAEKA